VKKVEICGYGAGTKKFSKTFFLMFLDDRDCV
jgi:hypothetical protein